MKKRFNSIVSILAMTIVFLSADARSSSDNLSSSAAHALQLHPVFSDNMVLQRDVPLVIWGKAEPKEKVTVSLLDQTNETTADDNGYWEVALKPLSVQKEGVVLKVVGKTTIEYKNILVGDVWIGSGQSNMEWGLQRTRSKGNVIKELKKNSKDQPRIMTILKQSSPKINLDGFDFKTSKWRKSTEKDLFEKNMGARGFSAVGYHFAHFVQKETGIPIGIINCSWGASKICTWLSPKSIESGGTNVEKKFVALLKSDDETAHTKMPFYKKMRGTARYLPSFAYNKMIHSLKNFKIKGVIWYQGESDIGTKGGEKYRISDDNYYLSHKKLLISQYREFFQDQNLPFYFVQLAPYARNIDKGGIPLWNDQRRVLEIPNTGMAVIHDTVDNIKNIHPLKKMEVGRRLSLWALANTYKISGFEYSGPLINHAQVNKETNEIILSFDHIGKGLAIKTSKYNKSESLNNFYVMSKDNKLHPVPAAINGNNVTLKVDDIKDPVKVVYCKLTTEFPNLFNADGLPASPFIVEIN